MPKEVIQSVSGYDYRLQISWGTDGIQVATVNPAAPAGTTKEGFFVDLDREGCNRAIRTLRKARDQAFGRDE